MENASKALIIIGSVLIAIIVISGLLYVSNILRNVTRTSDEAKKQEEISKFNKEYEAYNKQRLYGTDIISVVNKAIENNTKYNLLNDRDDSYYITIELNIKEDYTTTYEKKMQDGSIDRNVNFSEVSSEFGLSTEPPNILAGNLTLGKVEGTQYDLNPLALDIFKQDIQEKSKTVKKR